MRTHDATKRRKRNDKEELCDLESYLAQVVYLWYKVYFGFSTKKSRLFCKQRDLLDWEDQSKQPRVSYFSSTEAKKNPL